MTAPQQVRIPRRPFVRAGIAAGLFVLLATVSVGAQTPTRLTGVWQATVGVDYPPWTIVLEQRGDSLFGNVQQNGGLRGPSDIREGHVDRGRITFSALSPTGGRTIRFIGTLQGDSITFMRTVTVAADGVRIGTGLFGAGGAERFVMHRADSAAAAAPLGAAAPPPAVQTPLAVVTPPAGATPAAARGLASPVRQPVTVSVPAQTRQARVLVLYGFRPGSITHIVASATLHERLVEPLGDSVSIVEEFPEFTSTPLSERYKRDGFAATESFRRYLALRYSSTPFDLIMTVGAGGFGFYKVSTPALFPGVPVIACLVSADRIPREGMDSTVSIVSNSIGLKGTLSLALAMQPETRRVVVVGGGSSADLGYVERTRLVQQSLPADLRFDYVVGRSLAETERAVAQLDAHSIVLLLSFAADSAGNQYDRFEVARRLASVAKAPIYSSFGPWFGSGVVGGEMNMTDSNVARASALALRMLRGERFANLPRMVVEPTVRVLDDRALRRWRLDGTRAPSGTTVMYREPSLWFRYRAAISLTLALLLAQTAVIAALVVQRARRRRAELRGDALVAELRVSHDRIHQLAGHLITAQEAERTRIARELHDDVNQKIASLAIGLSRVRRHIADGGEAANDLSGLQERTATLADEVRHISHRLHSSVLQHAGLVAALDSACREFAIDHGIEVDVETRGDVDAVDYEIALCLYRVAQEALRNAARHAQARTVRVSVARDAHSICLQVADDGRGFDPRAARMERGLGLVSLEERARLVHGTLEVESNPGDGTIVRLKASLPPGVRTGLSLEDHAARPSVAG